MTFISKIDNSPKSKQVSNGDRWNLSPISSNNAILTHQRGADLGHYGRTKSDQLCRDPHLAGHNRSDNTSVWMQELLKSDSALTDQLRQQRAEMVPELEFNQSATDRQMVVHAAGHTNTLANNMVPDLTLLNRQPTNRDTSRKINHRREPSTMISVVRQEP